VPHAATIADRDANPIRAPDVGADPRCRQNPVYRKRHLATAGGSVGVSGVALGVGPSSEGDRLVACVERTGELVAVLAGFAAVVRPATR
jgi:hypothetical protein